MQKEMYTNNGRRGPCVHVLSGRVDGPKICMFNHECYHCAFDQWLDYMDESIDRKDTRTEESTGLPDLTLQAA